MVLPSLEYLCVLRSCLDEHAHTKCLLHCRIDPQLAKTLLRLSTYADQAKRSPPAKDGDAIKPVYDAQEIPLISLPKSQLLIA